MNSDDIENRFKFHPANAERGKMHDEVRNECWNLAISMNLKLPEGREKSTALTKLEEAMFWANAAIARN